MLNAILGIALVAGLVVFVLGYLIKVKGMATLIAGFDPNQVKEKQGLTDWVGTNAMLAGAVICLYSLVVWWLQEKAGLPVHLTLAVVLLALGVRTAYKARRY